MSCTNLVPLLILAATFGGRACQARSAGMNLQGPASLLARQLVAEPAEDQASLHAPRRQLREAECGYGEADLKDDLSFIGSSCINGGTCKWSVDCESGTQLDGECDGSKFVKCCVPKSDSEPLADVPADAAPGDSDFVGKACGAGDAGTCEWRSDCATTNIVDNDPACVKASQAVKCCLPDSAYVGTACDDGVDGVCGLASDCADDAIVDGKCGGSAAVKCCTGPGAATEESSDGNDSTGDENDDGDSENGDDDDCDILASECIGVPKWTVTGTYTITSYFRRFDTFNMRDEQYPPQCEPEGETIDPDTGFPRDCQQPIGPIDLGSLDVYFNGICPVCPKGSGKWHFVATGGSVARQFGSVDATYSNLDSDTMTPLGTTGRDDLEDANVGYGFQPPLAQSASEAITVELTDGEEVGSLQVQVMRCGVSGSKDRVQAVAGLAAAAGVTFATSFFPPLWPVTASSAAYLAGSVALGATAGAVTADVVDRTVDADAPDCRTVGKVLELPILIDSSGALRLSSTQWAVVNKQNESAAPVQPLASTLYAPDWVLEAGRTGDYYVEEHIKLEVAQG